MVTRSEAASQFLVQDLVVEHGAANFWRRLFPLECSFLKLVLLAEDQLWLFCDIIQYVFKTPRK